MVAPTNKRIYFAVQQVGIKGDGAASFNVIHGVQSVGMNTTFNLEQVFELGQLEIYENIEGTPDVEVTLQKVLDGYPLIWHEATIDATAPTLAGRSTAKCLIGLAVFNDTLDSANGTPLSEVETSGMYVSSLSYNFPLEDNFTEDVTLQGNNKVWANDSRIVAGAISWTNAQTLDFSGGFASNNDAPVGSGGVNRRENIIFAYTTASGLDTNGMVADPNATILPPEVYGISTSGTNEKSNGADYDAHISRIALSADITREELFEMGRLGPYFRSVTFPIEVTTEIEATATSGDMISATEFGILASGAVGTCTSASNLNNRSIRVATCEGTRIYTGSKNKLASVGYAGGDAGGGNVTVTYTYSTFNNMTVLHSGDPNTNGTDWWNARGNYLVDL